jgi:ParB-like nuclease family protein
MAAAGGPLAIQLVPVEKLTGFAAAWNPRMISDHDLASLRRSLRTFGTVEPIVVNRRTSRIVGGHQRVRAAELEGIRELPVVHVDLDEASEKQLNLALNRIHGEFDLERLAGVFRDLQVAGADLTLSGFEAGEIERLAQGAIESLGEIAERPLPSRPAMPVTRAGDVIELGVHRLVCGDSTEFLVMQRAVNGEQADAMWTDPPYGVDYEGGTEEKLRIRGDHAVSLPTLLRDAFRGKRPRRKH